MSEAVELQGERIVLRSYRPDEFEAAYEQARKSTTRVGEISLERMRLRVARSGRFVEGRLEARSGTIDAPIGRDRRDRLLVSIDTDVPREARTQRKPCAAAFRKGAPPVRLRDKSRRVVCLFRERRAICAMARA